MTNNATPYINTLYTLPERRAAQFTPAPATNVIFYSWWRADRSADLAPLPGFEVEITEDYQLLAKLARLDPAEVVARVRDGHRPYTAHLGGAAVAYGWAAARQASI